MQIIKSVLEQALVTNGKEQQTSNGNLED